MSGFLVNLLSEYEKITHYQIGRFLPGLSADEVVASCKDIVGSLSDLRRSIEGLLNEHLYPMLDDITAITDDDEAELYAAAQKLSAYETRLDPGLALRIYLKLLEKARFKNDDDKIIQYLYWCGITLFFFFKEQRDRILDYFKEGASFAARYDAFDSAATRQYIHRCLGNHIMLLYSVDRPQEAMELERANFSFWNALIFAKKDRDFPWLNYFLSCLNYKHTYLTRTIHSEPDTASKELLRTILDNAITINKLYHKNKELFRVFGGTRYDFYLWEAQFHSGLISFDLLIENINKKKAAFTPGDFSSDSMYVKIQLNTYLMFYATKMTKLHDRKDEIIQAASKETFEYLSSIPISVNPSSISEQLRQLAGNLKGVLTPMEQLDFVMKMTTYRHIPTYTHSIMVGKIASCLTRFLAVTNPGCFVGCIGIESAHEVQARIGELCNFAETSGLCHDIGKILYVCNPFMQIRTLTGEEFEIVKQHPSIGAEMMRREDGISLYDGFLDVIWGHHKHYDNNGGYPDEFDIGQSKHRVMVDIIAVADSIDAGTDDIGKTYTEAKSLNDVCGEIIAGASTRYAPYVAALLADEETLSALAGILETERKKAYYTAYLHACS